MDQLKKLREKVKKANDIYMDVREKARIPETEDYRRQTIKELSDPFIKGVFTLAVIGPMSAGKSAFINALLGDEDLLPTGHFQTTCTLTEISYSKEKRLKIVYGDGHIDDTTKGDGVLSKLKGVVSIPEEFNNLPINHINQFILAGNTFEEILNNKEVLMELSGRSYWDNSDDELLKKYVLSKRPSNIPVHVYLYYPLDEAYNGWRIVDTPGIGAIGGIDQTTKDFLNNKEESVDAAIFIFNGVKEIEATEISSIVNTSYSQLTDVAKERTFFVITHKGERTCYENLETTKQKALQLFSKGKVSIPKNRFLAVDSMLSLLYDISIKRYGLDPMIFTKSIVAVNKHFGVDDIVDEREREEKKKEIKMYRDMIRYIFDKLEENEIEVNSEVLAEEICSFAEFAQLRKLLGDFAANAKKDAYQKLLATIIDDFKSFGSQKKEDIELKRLKITKTPEEFAREIAAKLQQIHDYSESLQEKYNNLIVDYNEKNLKSTYYSDILDETKKKVNSARTTYQFQLEEDIESAIQNYLSSIKLKDETVFQKFVLASERLTKEEMDDKIPNIALKPIDISAVVKKMADSAESRATHSVKKEKTVTTNIPIRILSLGFAGKKKVTYYVDEINWAEKKENTKNETIGFLNAHIDAHCKTIQIEVVLPSVKKIQQQLCKLLEDKQAEYDTLLISQESENEMRAEISKLESEITMIISNVKEIEKL